MFHTFLRILFTPLRALYHWLLGEGFQSRKSGSGKTRLIIRRELYGLTHEPLMWFCMIVAPLFCVFFFTTMMEEGLPENLPLGIVDLDNSTTSRNLQRNLDAFQMVTVRAEYPNTTEARKAMQRGDIYGFYYIPKGLQRKANRQEQPTVSFYMNYSFLVAGSLLYKDQRIMSELASGAAVLSLPEAPPTTRRWPISSPSLSTPTLSAIPALTTMSISPTPSYRVC